jgi:ferric-chelate reductase
MSPYQDLSAALSSGPVQSPASVAAIPHVDSLELVFNGDIFLLAFFACFIVISIPRAFARLLSGWHHGHILWSARNNRRNKMLPSLPPFVNPTTEQINLEVLRPFDSRTNLIWNEHSGASSTPHHIRTFSSILHPITLILRRRILPGFSIGQALIFGIYGSILSYLTLYMSNIFTDPIRAGAVGMSQIPFIFAFATKNNLLGMLAGLGYEKV